MVPLPAGGKAAHAAAPLTGRRARHRVPGSGQERQDPVSSRGAPPRLILIARPARSPFGAAGTGVANQRRNP